MNNVVDKLLDVDKEARKTLDEAQEYYDTTICETKAELEKLRQDYDQRLQHYIQETQDAFQADAEKRISEITEKKLLLIETMNREYEAHQQQWQDTILQRCIARK